MTHTCYIQPICVCGRLIHMCDTTHSQTSQNSFTHFTHSDVSHNSFIYAAAKPTHIYHTTHLHMSHSSFPYHTTHSQMAHNAFTHVTQLIHICHTPHIPRNSSTYITQPFHTCHASDAHSRVTRAASTYIIQLIHICHYDLLQNIVSFIGLFCKRDTIDADSGVTCATHVTHVMQTLA